MNLSELVLKCLPLEKKGRELSSDREAKISYKDLWWFTECKDCLDQIQEELQTNALRQTLLGLEAKDIQREGYWLSEAFDEYYTNTVKEVIEAEHTKTPVPKRREVIVETMPLRKVNREFQTPCTSIMDPLGVKENYNYASMLNDLTQCYHTYLDKVRKIENQFSQTYQREGKCMWLKEKRNEQPHSD